jgi:hypothetical protein
MGKFHPLLIHQRLSLYDEFGHIEQPIVTTFCEIVMTNVDELGFLGGNGRGETVVRVSQDQITCQIRNAHSKIEIIWVWPDTLAFVKRIQ